MPSTLFAGVGGLVRSLRPEEIKSIQTLGVH